MGSNKVETLKDIDENMVVNFSEKCGVDFYLPEISTVFIGHDDHGFILVTCKGNLNILSNLKSLILKNSLFLLENN